MPFKLIAEAIKNSSRAKVGDTSKKTKNCLTTVEIGSVELSPVLRFSIGSNIETPMASNSPSTAIIAIKTKTDRPACE